MNEILLKKDIRATLLALMSFRVFIALACIGIIFWSYLSAETFASKGYFPLYILVITIGLLTLLYSYLLNKKIDLKVFAYVQLTIDTVLISYAIYITGAIESFLSPLYFLTIIGSTILLGRIGGYYIASMSAFFYTLLLLIDLYGLLPVAIKIIHTSDKPQWLDVTTSIGINFIAFYAVAFLTGLIVEKNIKIEKELKEREIDYKRLAVLNERIIEDISSGILTLNSDMRITSFNRAAEVITGKTIGEVYYRKFNEFFSEINIENYLDYTEGRFERKFHKSEDEIITLGFTVSKAKEKDIEWILIFQDLTEIKALEEQIRRDDRMKALGELSASLAHEIRNPLTSISGSVQLLKDDENINESNANLMSIICEEADRLNDLITDFLVFAKPASKTREIINVENLLKDSLTLFRSSKEAEKIEIKEHYEKGLSIEGDSRQIKQVLWNLFINAANAMDGTGVLKISTGKRKYGINKDKVLHSDGNDFCPVGDFVQISVEDTGVGIKEENINNIFDPFFSTKEKGTGLGLSLSHRIVANHGGTIEVRSEENKGTVFTLLIPLFDIVE